MADTLQISSGNKAERYAELLPQLAALCEEPDVIARLANVAAALWQTFGWHWVGFYLVQGEELVLGPFQGPVACTRIPFGRGVCGTAWQTAAVQLVDDVDAFPGHIACSSLSRSEVVVPVLGEDGSVAGVLDVDSTELAAFDQTDAAMLTEVARLLRL